MSFSQDALWNRKTTDLQSRETVAQIMDRGTLEDWRRLYHIAAQDPALRDRMAWVLDHVPLFLPHFWRAALSNLGIVVDWDAPVPREDDWAL